MAIKRSVTLSECGEFGLIKELSRSTPTLKKTILGIGDDTAVLPLNNKYDLLLTTDMLVEGVHFDHGMDFRNIGWKSLCCSISDIAAMGGIPKHAVISLGAPESLPLNIIKKIYNGIYKAAIDYGIDIVGGDTVKSANIIINVALCGEVEKGKAIYRSGAKIGDKIFVTGPLGNSFKSGWHLKFTPRVNESRYLIRYFNPTSMIDISDGLAGDLGHIMENSKAGAKVFAESIPLRKGARLENAFYDGEDFELLFTVPPKEAARLLKSKKFYYIGEIIKPEIGLVCEEHGKMKKIEPKGYRHF